MSAAHNHRIDLSTRRALLELLSAAATSPTAMSRLELLVDGFTAVLDGEIGGFNHVDVGAGRAMVLMRPQVVLDPTGALQDAFREHPVVRHYNRSGSMAPCVLSSCRMGRWRRWVDHPTYSALFRPMGTPHEIVIPLGPIGGRRGSAYAVTRNGTDFGTHELSIGHACQELLRILHDHDRTLAAVGRTALLTVAERSVLELYSMRLTEAQIAAHRGTSRETVHTQINTGCAKLEIFGRYRPRTLARVFGHLPAMPTPTDRLARLLDS